MEGVGEQMFMYTNLTCTLQSFPMFKEITLKDRPSPLVHRAQKYRSPSGGSTVRAYSQVRYYCSLYWATTAKGPGRPCFRAAQGRHYHGSTTEYFFGNLKRQYRLSAR